LKGGRCLELLFSFKHGKRDPKIAVAVGSYY